MTMSKKNARPNAHDSHDATRRADQVGRSQKVQLGERDHAEYDDVNQNQQGDGGSGAQPAKYCGRQTLDVDLGCGTVLGFESLKNMKLFAQLSGRMQNLQRPGEPGG